MNPTIDLLTILPSNSHSASAWQSCVLNVTEGRVQELLALLDNTARGNENLVPLFIECVETGITLGEICNLLRRIWGEYRAPASV